MAPSPAKFLIIRFSAFGDVVQFMSVPAAIAKAFQGAEIHWLTRHDFRAIAEGHPHVRRVWTIDPHAGMSGILRVVAELKSEGFTHVYDGHSNIRSRLVCAGLNGFLGLRRLINGHRFLRRSKYRFRRVMLFWFRKNLYPRPFPGQWSLIEPLKQWGVSTQLPPAPQLFLNETQNASAAHHLASITSQKLPIVCLAPSASYEMKRWPIKHWEELLRIGTGCHFVFLGGPADTFIEVMVRKSTNAPVTNLAGKLSLMESAAMVSKAAVLISGDTGLMHVAEQLGVPCIALMGPAPFGYPARPPKTIILERDLPCRPCSKHGEKPCSNRAYHQQCLVDISPLEVWTNVQKILQI